MFDERALDQRRTDAGDDLTYAIPARCLITCKQVVEYEDATFEGNPYLRSDFINKLKVDKAYGGPEYETLGSLGSACGAAPTT